MFKLRNICVGGDLDVYYIGIVCAHHYQVRFARANSSGKRTFGVNCKGMFEFVFNVSYYIIVAGKSKIVSGTTLEPMPQGIHDPATERAPRQNAPALT